MKSEFKNILKIGIIFTAIIYALGLFLVFFQELFMGLSFLFIAGIMSLVIIVLALSTKLPSIGKTIEKSIDEFDSETEEKPYQSIIYTLAALIPLALILYLLLL